MSKKECKFCGIEFTPYRNRKTQVFCSRNCNDKYKNKKTKFTYTFSTGETIEFSKSRLWHYNNKYNLTLEQLCKLYDKQEGKCAVSGLPISFSDESGRCILDVDHDHETGDVRYLLHPSINKSLGFLEACGVSHDLAFKKIKEMFV